MIEPKNARKRKLGPDSIKPTWKRTKAAKNRVYLGFDDVVLRAFEELCVLRADWRVGEMTKSECIRRLIVEEFNRIHPTVICQQNGVYKGYRFKDFTKFKFRPRTQKEKDLWQRRSKPSSTRSSPTLSSEATTDSLSSKRTEPAVSHSTGDTRQDSTLSTPTTSSSPTSGVTITPLQIEIRRSLLPALWQPLTAPLGGLTIQPGQSTVSFIPPVSCTSEDSTSLPPKDCPSPIEPIPESTP